jgi:fimbrial isopeptide formation D2 family protein
MKKKFLLLIVICAMLQVINTGKAFSLTTVHISQAADTFGNPNCPVPAYKLFWCNGTTSGYNVLTDSMSVHVYFGDGNDTLFKTPLNVDSNFWATMPHIYYSVGTYSMKFVVTGPDGTADSIIHINYFTLADTCGNIGGKVYVDVNNNCIFDAGDSALMGYPVEILQGLTIVGYAYTGLNGDYYFNVPTGNTYTVQPLNPTGAGFQVNCPTSGNYSINLTTTSYGNDFGLNCLNGFDMAGYALGWYFRPNYDAYMEVSAYNLRCEPTSGTVKLVLDPLVTYVNTINGIPPTTISGDTLIWDYTNMSNEYYDYWWWYWYSTNEFWSYMTLHTSPNAVLGNMVCFDLIVDPIVGDIDPTNNTEQFCKIISNSWDPNFKQVNPVGVGPNGSISPNQKLTYTIHYQNVGNDTAYNVAIYDTLDANLDVNTLQVLNSDHNFSLELLPGNVLKIIFNNIMLPDSAINPAGSQGTVNYVISPKAGLANGTMIYNKAAITFDFNLPVFTNQTHNMIDDALGIKEIASNYTSISVYPNPVSNNLTINYNLSASSNVSINVFDMLGSRIAEIANDRESSGQHSIPWNASTVPQGIYLLQFMVDNKIINQKITVMK